VLQSVIPVVFPEEILLPMSKLLSNNELVGVNFIKVVLIN
jgi:hypothetical protein